MIDFYNWPTPNGQRAQIMLEETGLEYELHLVKLSEGEQYSAKFLAVNPNGKIPALVDREGPDGPVTIFESGAMLLYLAEKSGQFLPSEPRRRWEAISWLMFQAAGVGPNFGHAGYYRNRAPEPVPAAAKRFSKEVERLFAVIDGRLAEKEYLAGTYSIADIAGFPWLRMYERMGIVIDHFPNVVRWMATIAKRPAVQRVLKDS
jgi:GST-like protein